MSQTKEKRTKEQVIRLLDRALEQEDSLLEKVKWLENELLQCQKRADNPRHELEEQAIPGSKVSFRLDFYRLEDKGPIKGIIEHLPTRARHSFDGARFFEIRAFAEQFVHTRLQEAETKTSTTAPDMVALPEKVENPPAPEKKERSPLLKRLFPEFFGAPDALMPQARIAPSAKTPSALEAEAFLVLTEGVDSHQRAIRAGQPIQVLIPMQGLELFQEQPCLLKLTAKSMVRQDTPPVEIESACTPDKDSLCLPLKDLSLERGAYRLNVHMHLLDAAVKDYYQQSRLLIVQ